jgi:hypothetical protein
MSERFVCFRVEACRPMGGPVADEFEVQRAALDCAQLLEAKGYGGVTCTAVHEFDTPAGTGTTRQRIWPLVEPWEDA